VSDDDLLARWPEAERIVDGVLDLPADARRQRARDACALDPALWQLVERLLAEADRDEPLVAVDILADEPALDVESPPQQIGPYRVLGQLGRGRMGWVLRAVRDGSPAPPVALKLLDVRARSREALKRFDRERETMARLQHPNIARLVDGGIAEDRTPYLVMELVEGTRVDAFCDTNHLDVAARLRLFLQVCAAVEYAHSRLVVHRDLKPANVLVDQFGQVKLLDFGIAKWLDGLEADGLTQTSHRVLTPAHAAPEQFRGEPVTAATDVYQLGLLLYELLTGRGAHGPSETTPEALQRAVLDTDPEAPSRAVGRLDGVTDQTTLSADVAQKRASTTAALARHLAGDLDAVVLKALRKESAVRYASVEALRRDVEAHLAHRPVSALRGSRAYLVQKYARRHRAGVAAAAGVVLALVAGLVGVAAQARRADQERDRAQARLTDVRRLANTLIFDVYDRVENSPNATPIRRWLVEKGLEYLDRVAADATSDPTLSLELADAYRRLAEVQGTPGKSNLGDREEAAQSLEKARSILAPFLARADTPVAIDVSYLNLTRQLAVTLADHPDRARPLTVENLERARRLQERHRDNNTVTEAVAHTYFYAALSRPDNQLDLWTEANRMYQALIVAAPGNHNHLRSLALTEKYIGTIHEAAKRSELARTNYERALELDRQVQKLRPDDRKTTIDIAIDLGNLASVLWRSVPPALDKAAALYRDSLAQRERAVAQDPRDVYARQALGFCLMQLCELSRSLGDVDAAVGYGHRAVDAYEALPDSMNVARRGNAWLVFGKAVIQARRRAEGCAALRRAQQYFTQASVAPAQPPSSVAALASVGEALAACRP
jgi:serine/threonine protein kinase